MAAIPVIDCSNGLFSVEQELFDALVDGGFVYLKNSSIDPEKIAAAFNLSKELWSLDKSVRLKYARDGGVAIHGYIGINGECLQGRAVSDFKEAFNVAPFEAKEAVYPEEIPGFKSTTLSLMEDCYAVVLQVLKILSARFDDKDNVMLRGHEGTLKKNGLTSGTTLRLLHYPSVSADIQGKENMMRCGEHADFGSLTLLFQDDIGGLEVQRRDGEFVPATPVEGAVLLNTGYLMARWTSDKIQAVRHRVGIPLVDDPRNTDRYSMACFIDPDDEFLIAPIDGSDCYAPITTAAFIQAKLSAAFE